MDGSASHSAPEIYFVLSYIFAMLLLGLSKAISAVARWRLEQQPQLIPVKHVQLNWVWLTADTVAYAQTANLGLLFFRRGGVPQAGVFFERLLPAGSATNVSLMLLFIILWSCRFIVAEFGLILQPFRNRSNPS